MLPETDPKTVLAAAMAANAFLTAPLALLIKRDFRRLGRASWAAAVWSGIAMHGHALATFAIAWLDRGSLYAPAAWSVAAGGALAGTGLFIIVLGRRAYASRARVYGLREDELIERGVYRRTRNPQYAGYGVMFAGAAIAAGSSLAFVFSGVFALLIHVYITWVEEPHLKRAFGAEYDAYCARVGRYFRF